MPRVIVKAVFENIRFKCTRCGSCCHHKRPDEFGDLIASEELPEFWEKSNLIYLTEMDIKNISRKSSLNLDDFVDSLYGYDGHLVKVEDSGSRIILDLPVLKSKIDTTCVFYDSNQGCTIHPARPTACRLFPFRVEEETTPEGDITLRISYNASCPGIRKGKYVDKSALERMVADQFLVQSRAVATEVQGLAAQGRIKSGARVYRTHPGRRPEASRGTGPE